VSGRAHWLGWATILVVFIWSARATEVSAGRVVEGLPFMLDFLRRMVPPDWSVLRHATTGAIQTIEIALVGTGAAALLALPMGFAAARNAAPPWLFYGARIALNVFRGVDTLVYALFFKPAPAPLDINAGNLERFSSKFAYGMGLSRRNHKITWLLLLEHQMHCLHVFRCPSPVALHLEDDLVRLGEGPEGGDRIIQGEFDAGFMVCESTIVDHNDEQFLYYSGTRYPHGWYITPDFKIRMDIPIEAHLITRRDAGTEGGGGTVDGETPGADPHFRLAPRGVVSFVAAALACALAGTLGLAAATRPMPRAEMCSCRSAVSSGGQGTVRLSPRARFLSCRCSR
jgi:hypothetical protein